VARYPDSTEAIHAERLRVDCASGDRTEVGYRLVHGTPKNHSRPSVEFPSLLSEVLAAASLPISADANVKAVQKILGRASAAMTLDVYARPAR